jgi:DNA-binding transcriptional ArsR family regulator
MKINITGLEKGNSRNEDLLSIFQYLDLTKDETRLNILSILKESGETGKSFSEIVRITGSKPTKLAYHLKLLVKSGLIRKGFPEEMKGREHTCYRICRKGLGIWSICDILRYTGDDSIEGHHLQDYTEKIRIIPFSAGPRLFTIMEMK